MRYVLDTNIILFYLKDSKTKAFIKEIYNPFGSENEAVISAVTIGEIKSLAIRNGWGEKRVSLVEKIMQDIIVIDVKFNELFDAYAEIEAYCEGKLPSKPVKRSSRILGKNDLWIAATTYITGSKLMTSDKDFLPLDGEYFEVVMIDRDEINNR
jgi:predicted nucleic acid-binding protein